MKQEKKYLQTEAHDWLGDAAENLVAYQMAHAGFEVFAAGKWGADVVVHEKTSDRWWRIEVRSTDRDKRPIRKPPAKLKEIAEILAEVRLREGYSFEIRYHYLTEGKRSGFVDNPSFEELRNFFIAQEKKNMQNLSNKPSHNKEYPFYFVFDPDEIAYKSTGPEEYFKKMEDGSEIPITRKSNNLENAVANGRLISEADYKAYKSKGNMWFWFSN